MSPCYIPPSLNSIQSTPPLCTCSISAHSKSRKPSTLQTHNLLPALIPALRLSLLRLPLPLPLGALLPLLAFLIDVDVLERLVRVDVGLVLDVADPLLEQQQAPRQPRDDAEGERRAGGALEEAPDGDAREVLKPWCDEGLALVLGLCLVRVSFRGVGVVGGRLG